MTINIIFSLPLPARCYYHTNTFIHNIWIKKRVWQIPLIFLHVYLVYVWYLHTYTDIHNRYIQRADIRFRGGFKGSKTDVDTLHPCPPCLLLIITTKHGCFHIQFVVSRYTLSFEEAIWHTEYRPRGDFWPLDHQFTSHVRNKLTDLHHKGLHKEYKNQLHRILINQKKYTLSRYGLSQAITKTNYLTVYWHPRPIHCKRCIWPATCQTGSLSLPRCSGTWNPIYIETQWSLRYDRLPNGRQTKATSLGKIHRHTWWRRTRAN